MRYWGREGRSGGRRRQPTAENGRSRARSDRTASDGLTIVLLGMCEAHSRLGFAALFTVNLGEIAGRADIVIDARSRRRADDPTLRNYSRAVSQYWLSERSHSPLALRGKFVRSTAGALSMVSGGTSST